MTTPTGSSGTPPRRTQAREARQQVIVEHVVAHGVATVSDLADLTGASLMTVHRDLDELVRRGVVRKFHGGVSAQPSTVFESSSEYRRRVQIPEKEALAAAALEIIEPGMSIMLDTSTTNLFLAQRLASSSDVGLLTVVTNYLPILQTLRGASDVRIIAVGGDYNSTHDAFLGMGALEAVKALSVDIVFLSTSAMTPETTYHQEPDIVMIKRAMMNAGQRRVLLMDHTKLGRTALHRLAPTSDFDQLVVSGGTPAEVLRDIGDHVPLTQA